VLFETKCFACHGTTGGGDGPAAAQLNPPPIAFTNHERARERSLFSLYEVISQGLADTPMKSFQDTYSDDERWDLAFYVSTFASTPELRQQGEKIWQDDAALRARLPNLEALSHVIEAGLGAEIGDDKARAVMSYLRSNPAAVGHGSAAGLSL